ncbi:MAG: QueT transporter family protein [Lachnospiraceae bacterium]|nr:QueT transporter family protein [Lachnospiraceae bacterium]
MRNKKVLFLAQAAIIAALYVAFSWVSQAFGLASGQIQVRISEAFCVLAFFSPAAIPGLTLGCLIFNLSSGCILPDVICGSIATLVGALATYFLAKLLLKNKNAFGKDGFSLKDLCLEFTCAFPTVIANAIIVPFVLPLYGVEDAYWFMFLTVGAGELIACEIIGLILYHAILPFKNKIFQ